MFQVIGSSDNILHFHYLQEPLGLGSEPSRNVSEVKFLLYTRENPLEEQILTFDDRGSVDVSNFDPEKSTKILIHGYTDNGKVDWIKDATAAYLEKGTMSLYTMFHISCPTY